MTFDRDLRIYSIIDFCVNQTRVEITVHSLLRLAKSANVRLKNGRISMPPAFVESAECRCRAGEETPQHIALYCTDEAESRQHLRMNGRLNYQKLIGTNGGAKRFSEWMICSGRLGQFSLPS